jgi:hypothetical protein
LEQERISTHQCQLFAAAAVASRHVAYPAGEAQILKVVGASEADGDDVVDRRAVLVLRARPGLDVYPSATYAAPDAIAVGKVPQEHLAGERVGANTRRTRMK